jgi:precorrin-6A/cobalt-precorrin-6A reductase
VNHGDVLVMGGTSDARAICQQLDAAGVRYTLSVATPPASSWRAIFAARCAAGAWSWQQMAPG